MAGREKIESGRSGENAAVVLLESEGYRIICRNYSSRFGEIDVIAESSGTVVFVEVRKRTGGAFGAPEDSVDSRKRARIIKTALMFIKERGLSSAGFRFDIIAVTGGAPQRIEHIEDAFCAPPKYYI